MSKLKLDAIAHPGWDISFWFAVLSQVLGVVVGLTALFLFYH
jgi:hypothetical protein